MKRILLILLICAYSLSTVGVGFKEFYCCGKLKAVLITLDNSNKQGCTKEGCCKTRQQFLKLQDNHIASANVFLPANHLAVLHCYTPAFNTTSFNQQSVQANHTHAPLLYDDDLPIYLSNCVFRIWYCFLLRDKATAVALLFTPLSFLIIGMQ